MCTNLLGEPDSNQLHPKYMEKLFKSNGVENNLEKS
jgi:hypothetical protein